MQIELSPQIEKALKSLMLPGDTPEAIIERALQHYQDDQLPKEYFDHETGETYGLDGLRQKVAEADAAIAAGDYTRIDSSAETQALMDEIQRTGREKLAQRTP